MTPGATQVKGYCFPEKLLSNVEQKIEKRFAYKASLFFYIKNINERKLW